MTKVINSTSSKVIGTNKLNILEVNNENIIESNSDIREVLPKGYLLSQINLSSIPSVIADAINQAMIDTKDATLADALIDTLRTSLQNLDDGIYKKTFIDNTITYLENLLTSKVDLETVASIADNKLAIALQGFVTTSSVSTLLSRVENSETEIINVKETINTKDTARATQINEMEARVNDTFAGYSDAIDLYVDENGNVKSEKIETLSTNIGLQIQEVNQLIVDTNNEWNAKSIKLITSPSGAITGYSFQNGSGVKSNFDIYADNFKISNSYNTYSPFSIIGTSLYFNGKVNFSNVTGTDGVVTTSNVQTAINNNVTTIDGGKITTNQVFVNNLNATGGVIADTVKSYSLTSTNATIENGLITNAKIADASITNAKIGDEQVTNSKIANASITNAKIANLSVDTLKIQDEAVIVPRYASGNGTATIYYTPAVNHTIYFMLNVPRAYSNADIKVYANGIIVYQYYVVGDSSHSGSFPLSVGAGTGYTFTITAVSHGEFDDVQLYSQLLMLGIKK